MKMNQPPVTRINLEYADGSIDNITLLQRGDCPLFRLERKQPETEKRNLGAYTAGAIAGLLFRTAANTERIEQPFDDPKLTAVLRVWYEDSPPSKKNEAIAPN